MHSPSFCLSLKLALYAFYTFVIVFIVAISSSCSILTNRSWESSSKYLREAEACERQGDFEQAIRAYRQHIRKRLEKENRPEWENPAFYLLLIGDLYLQQSLVKEALLEYEQARLEGVARSLVADRFRLVAAWLAEKGQTQEAIEILSLYREEDPVLFDLMRDRVVREKVAHEEMLLQCYTMPSDACPKQAVEQSDKSERLPKSDR
jgi:tetratricopeptide (TPR) repeat protein